jgi:SAM-dependent methyltransferase
MLDEARRRAREAGVTAEFEVGDAMALAFPDDTFDATRSERTFQWLPKAEAALAEMVRVTRPGGTVVVIDTDWGSFSIDHPEPAVTRKIFDHFENSRTEHTVGRRLGRLFRAAGLTDVAVVARAAVITDWDPDARPGPPGLPSLEMFIESVVETGGITADEGASWLENVTRLGRAGDFCAALTIYAACGTKPAG